MILKSTQIRAFQMKIFLWWKTNRRDLPWRKTHDPYKILVSEIMLQQTQVSRVLPKYIEFLEKFPTAKSLAKASFGDVLRIWQGMGYNRRALYLHASAKNVVTVYNNIFPTDENKLLSLPGVGKYTARAILVFAYKKDIAMVDTNIRQILTHFFFRDVSQTEKAVQEIADQLVPKGKSWEWHQALMDYGALELERKQVKKAKTTVVFKESTRYFRGRMLDLVTQHTWNEHELLIQMQEQYKKDSIFMNTILHALLKDSLISRSKTGIISLPE